MLLNKVYNMAGEVIGEVTLSEAVFGIEPNQVAIHAAIKNHLANKRQGTQSALTRAEVSGGGAKPFRQKGTGRARQGSTRGPHYTHGGVAFAPKPRSYRYTLNKKLKRLALKSAFSVKTADSCIIVLDKLSFDGIKTKQMAKVLKSLEINNALFVINENDKNVTLSARNIPDVKTALVNTINVYDILKYDTLVMTKDAADSIQEVYA